MRILGSWIAPLLLMSCVTGSGAIAHLDGIPVRKDASSRDEPECDPAWDGALFGLLPGLFGGFLLAVRNAEGAGGAYVVSGIGIGIGGGLVLDSLHCDSDDQKQGQERGS